MANGGKMMGENERFFFKKIWFSVIFFFCTSLRQIMTLIYYNNNIFIIWEINGKKNYLQNYLII